MSGRAHFDGIAAQYDRMKRRQPFYNAQLRSLASSLTGPIPGRSVLELGCGTGQVLKHLDPRRGLGIDRSLPMVEQARMGAPASLTFQQGDILSFVPDQAFDLVVCCDVLEHLAAPGQLFERFTAFPGQPRFVLTWPNPRWFPLMRAGEALRLKTPEGPLYAHPLEGAARSALERGLTVVDQGYALLLPVAVPLLTRWLNQRHRRGLLRRQGLIQYLVLTK
jgi:SAM-dependent methyltransferase